MKREKGRKWTYLARAHLVKGHERKRLREHGPREVLFREDERDGHGAEEELGDEG